MAAKISLSLIALSCLAAGALGQAPMQPGDIRPKGALTDSMGLDQKQGAQVPLDATFSDENGKAIRFGDLLQGRPIVMLPMFYNCQGVCRLEMNALFDALVKEKGTAGKDFDVVFLGIHPKETPDLAKAKERVFLEAYKRPGAEEGFHMLTGRMDSIRQVTDAVGFRFTYSEATNQINHPAGLVFLSDEGKVTGYMYGASYPNVLLRKNIDAAAKGQIGVEPEVILLGCIMLDPVTGKKTIVVQNVMKLAGIATVLILAFSVVYMSRKYKVDPMVPGGRS